MAINLELERIALALTREKEVEGEELALAIRKGQGDLVTRANRIEILQRVGDALSIARETFVRELAKTGTTEPERLRFLALVTNKEQPKSDEKVAESVLVEAFLDRDSQTVLLKGKRIRFTKGQFPIVSFLNDHSGKFVSADVLAHLVSRGEKITPAHRQRVYEQLREIRNRLKKEVGESSALVSAKGKGYQLIIDSGQVSGLQGKEKVVGKVFEIGDAARIAKLSLSTIRNFADQGLLEKETHFRFVGHGTMRKKIVITQEGLNLLVKISKIKNGRKLGIATLLGKLKAKVDQSERKFHYKQVHLNAVKAAKLADRLASLPVDIQTKYGVTVSSGKKEVYEDMWKKFANDLDEEKRKKIDFKEVMNKLRADLLAFCIDPEKAYLFMKEKQTDTNVVYLGNLPELFAAVEDVLMMLTKIESSSGRRLFVEDLLMVRGPLLVQHQPGDVISLAQ